MRTECCECDRTAASFWGDHPYCSTHLRGAKARETGHKICEVCDRWKPNTIACVCGLNVCQPCFGGAHERHQTQGLSYEEYLASPAWRNKRAERIKLDRRCMLCSNEDEALFVVHHNTYERLGHEDLNDLVTLCATCHSDYHGRIET